jgi:hypothetical protein
VGGRVFPRSIVVGTKKNRGDLKKKHVVEPIAIAIAIAVIIIMWCIVFND